MKVILLDLLLPGRFFERKYRYVLAAAQTETALFSNVAETRAEKPTGYPEGNTKETNKYVSRLNGKKNGNSIGHLWCYV
jgi:hypothetical protein